VTIPEPCQESYRALYEAGVLRELLGVFFQQAWDQTQGLDQCRSASEAIFLLRARLLEVKNNPNEFVPWLWASKPPQQRSNPKQSNPKQEEMF